MKRFLIAFAGLTVIALASGCASAPSVVPGPQVLRLERCPAVGDFVPPELPEPAPGAFVSFDTPEMQAALQLRDLGYDAHVAKLRAALDCYERQVRDAR